MVENGLSLRMEGPILENKSFTMQQISIRENKTKTIEEHIENGWCHGGLSKVASWYYKLDERGAIFYLGRVIPWPKMGDLIAAVLKKVVKKVLRPHFTLTALNQKFETIWDIILMLITPQVKEIQYT